ncbi:hypothetical protein [Mycobacterium lepromatosis]|uniref:hypothetical protein n=2 Tax=Mycobacterium lepromatosis TaxID=480418 RepID=UPI0012E066AD|nr:hypothetical protein [Mycobacterium lepromatosis]
MPHKTAIDMIERAALGLIERYGGDLIEGAGVLITYTKVSDLPFHGASQGVARRLSMRLT